MASSSRAFVGVGVGAAPVPRVRSARALSSALTRRVCVRPRAVVGLGCRALTSPTTLRQISCPRDFARPRRGTLSVTAAAVPAAAAAAALAAEAATATAASAATAATATVVATGGSFWGYFFSFLFGGVFFSTALGVATIFISVGSANVAKAWRVFKFLSSRVWTLVLATIKAVKVSINNKDQTFADTKAVFQEGLQKTKKEVDESLRAFNEEKDFYAAAVGVPGLRTAQYVIDHMMPGLLAAKLEQSLSQSIANVKHPNVKRMILKTVTAGKAAPLLTGARFYDVGDDDMAFDVDVSWESDIQAGMDVVPAMGLLAEGLARVPVLIHDVKFDGTVRVLMARLSRKDPGYGAIVLSFPEPPVIALDVRVGGGLEVNRVPWLRKAVSDATKSWIKEEMLWPRRMLIPAEASLKPGGTPVNVLTDSELRAVLTDDPLLRAERNLVSLKELATGELGTKKGSGKMRASDDFGDGDRKKVAKASDLTSSGGDEKDADAVSGSMDDEFLVDVEITDPDHPRSKPPTGPSTGAKVWSWLGSTAKASLSKTVELSKATFEGSKNIARSDDTKRVLQSVASTPSAVGSWFEKDARSWINNVAARATGGTSVDNDGFPTAKMWVDPPSAGGEKKKETLKSDEAEGATVAAVAAGSKKEGNTPSKKNGGSASGGGGGRGGLRRGTRRNRRCRKGGGL